MRNRFTFGTVLAGMFLMLPRSGSAQTLHITPSLIDASHSVEEALETHKSHASTSVEGEGKILQITYRSSEPLDVYMVPMQADHSYVPTDYVRLTLPMAEEGTVAIDLTVSPGWSPKSQQWLLSLLGKDEKTDAAFTDIQFTNADAPSTFVVALTHFFTKEPYTPSSYHALRGYRILGFSLTEMLGLLVVILTLLCFAVAGRTQYRRAAILTLVLGSFLYQARFSIDLLRFTKEHLSEYAQGTYDEAGSIHAVADVLRTLTKSEKNTTVYVCRDGTNFKEKLLRYFTYPIHVSSEKSAAAEARYAVVMDKFKWGFTTTVTKESSMVILKCGDLERQAQRLNTFPGGEILFRLFPDKQS